MTLEDATERTWRVVRTALHKHPDNWRRGQAAFNIVHMYWPNVADALRGGPYDPFHDDDKIDSFVNEAVRLLSEYPELVAP